MDNFNKKIIFISYNNTIGSDILRAKQIVNILNNKNIIIISQCKNDTDIIKYTFYNEIKKYKYSLFIWVGNIDIDIINMIDYSNNHVYDIIDTYLYKNKLIDNILNKNLINGLIVNNKFTLNYLYSNTNFNGLIDIIYHHWDVNYKNATLNYQDELIFGYMGSLPSLKHTNNFLYYEKLINIFKIKLLNTENFKYYNNNIIEKNNYSLENININFNCHISIREIDSNVFKFKTTAKIATASIFNHNIITTNEESVKDLLSEDYPFIIKKNDFNSVKNMFEIVIKDYNSDKILWNKGLAIMKKVKENLNLEKIKYDYINMINRYIDI
jgi:hypothetical protein